MVEKLLFLTITRADIAYAVNLVSRYMENPQETHLKVVKSIIRYLVGTTSLGLFYRKWASLHLIGYSDADWGGDLDEQKSTHTFVNTVGDNPILWRSKKQTCLSLSSTESYYRALEKAAEEAIWIQGLFTKLGFYKQNTFTIYCDNQSAIKMSKIPIFHSKTKHFEIHLHFIRVMVNKKKIQVLYISTDRHPADIMTTWPHQICSLPRTAPTHRHGKNK
jgi:hypothetical protein